MEEERWVLEETVRVSAKNKARMEDMSVKSYRQFKDERRDAE